LIVETALQHLFQLIIQIFSRPNINF